MENSNSETRQCESLRRKIIFANGSDEFSARTTMLKSIPGIDAMMRDGTLYECGVPTNHLKNANKARLKRKKTKGGRMI